MKRGIVSRHVLGDDPLATGNWIRGLAATRKHLLYFLLTIGLGLLVLALVGCDGLLPCCW